MVFPWFNRNRVGIRRTTNNTREISKEGIQECVHCAVHEKRQESRKLKKRKAKSNEKRKVRKERQSKKPLQNISNSSNRFEGSLIGRIGVGQMSWLYLGRSQFPEFRREFRKYSTVRQYVSIFPIFLHTSPQFSIHRQPSLVFSSFSGKFLSDS